MGLFELFKSVRELKKAVKEAVESSKRYIEMTDEEVVALDDDCIVDAIYDRIGDKAEALGGFDALNKHQLAFFVVYELDMEVQNGGLCQYLCNSTGEKAKYVECSLKVLSFDKTAELFKDFITKSNIDLSLFDGDVDYDDCIDEYDFDSFDDEYIELYRTEQIYDNMVRFAREHYELLK